MEPLDAPHSQREMGEAWAKFVIERWVGALEKYDIGGGIPGDLERSFRAQVEVDGNGDLQRIELAYLYYGLFVDMGVGRGTKNGDQRDNSDSRKLMGKVRGNARQAKPWLTKTTPGQLFKLGDLLQIDAADRAGRIVMQTLPRELNIDL
ncbi:hypothetical protein [Hymenobacter baengnokdamensis]|uniref:hypothetical protein n=1 Tax=Hymenobacter baengnokdamensis TaxID=2615203 RepID=UPI0012453120|nr:hypothetical protein [Hymenobacter baengnokdamensis]